MLDSLRIWTRSHWTVVTAAAQTPKVAFRAAALAALLIVTMVLASSSFTVSRGQSYHPGAPICPAVGCASPTLFPA